MRRTLKIAKDLSLPLEAVTQTFAILAKRGMGKSYTAAVMAEQMIQSGVPIVIMDPLGVFWGLRANADGKHEGLPIIIFGGDHADVPLESTAGEMIADLIVDERVSAVLDHSRFRKAEQNRFVTAFGERLYHKNRKPLHLFLDEADSFAPQRAMHGEERMLGAMEDIVRRGRARGIGITLVTQRSAVINKNVLSQAEVLIALRTIAPQDRDAINAWVEIHGTPAQKKELMESLASLEIGEAWFWSPGWLDTFKRIHVNKRQTFDSSATPKMGVRMREPKKLAPVDLKRIREKMSSTIERAKSEDPRELRQKVAQLESELRMIKVMPPPVNTTKTVEVKVPFFTKREKKKVDDIVSLLEEVANNLSEELSGGLNEINGLGEKFRKLLAKNLDRAVREIKTPGKPVESYAPAKHQPTVATNMKVTMTEGNEPLLAGERRMIEVIRRVFPFQLTKVQLATLSGLSIGGTFNNYFGKLKRQKMIEEQGGKVVVIALPMSYEPVKPITAVEVMDMWKAKMLAGERRMLDTILSIKEVTKQELGERVGLVYPSGTYNNYLGTLKRNGLVTTEGDVIKISETLFLGVR